MIELSDALIVFSGPRGRGMNAADPHLGLPHPRVFPALCDVHQHQNAFYTSCLNDFKRKLTPQQQYP